ncbi:MAG: DMT family transporter [Candidatus Baltobacteraceae bacterium]
MNAPHASSDRERKRAFLALLVLAFAWGLNWVVLKVAVAYAPPLVFAAARMIGGGIALLGLCAWRRRGLRPQHLLTYTWIGLFQTAGFMGLVMSAIAISGVGAISTLAYTMPLWVALAGVFFLGERLHPLQVVALVFAMLGIVAIVGFDHLGRAGYADLLALLAGLAWAVGVVITKRLANRVEIDVIELTTWQMLAGGAALGIAAWLVPHAATHYTWPYIGALAYNIFIATALAYVLWVYVLDRLPARDASMGVLTNPIVGIVAAWGFLGEIPSASVGWGIALTLAGLALMAYADRAGAQ